MLDEKQLEIINKIKYLKDKKVDLKCEKYNQKRHENCNFLEKEQEILEEIEKTKNHFNKPVAFSFITTSQISVCSYKTLDRLIDISISINIEDDLEMYDIIYNTINSKEGI